MAMSWYPGKTTVEFFHSDEPLILPSKSDSGPPRALPELVKDAVPPCSLNPLLFNGHLQTFWTASNRGGPPIHYKRRVFESNDSRFAGHFTVDFATAPPPEAGKAKDGGPEDEGLREDPVGIGHHRLPPRTTYFTNKEVENLGSEDTKPLIIALHGLSGGSYEVYLRHVLAPLLAQTAEGEAAGGLSGADWEALVVNSRGCAGSKITSNILYNARATWDVRQVVKWCREMWPKRPLYAIGFSLGANILATYLGEEGSNSVLSGAIIVSNPWKLEVSSLALQRTYMGMAVYSKAMGDSMRKLFNTHADQIKHIDGEKIQQIKYLHEFDEEVQTKTWGYPTAGAYYRDASSADSVLAIRTPTLCLHARDDPIACDEAVPYEEIQQNPYVVMCATGGGGHLSWFEWGGGRWHAKPAVEFLNAMAKGVDSSKIEMPKAMSELPANPAGHKMPFVFEPMRRKCHLADGEP
ncbi:uncharacterized protein LTR77_010532 [Saxophila tyrrhenica]|uniref:alcohol O-acetyltransferase n=1 Tax=Saxophila tyrrhenica TaxID=1690608 RepID=A0AAV9NYF7_9PEZI|nr:hypothetical protein LTR77_010532 [Saxophila tyrrhenica]